MATGDFHHLEKWKNLYDNGLITPNQYKEQIYGNFDSAAEYPTLKIDGVKEGTLEELETYLRKKNEEAEIHKLRQAEKEKFLKILPKCDCPVCGRDMTAVDVLDYERCFKYLCYHCQTEVVIAIKTGILPKDFFWNNFKKVPIDG